MQEEDRTTSYTQDGVEARQTRTVSRREFLKIAGVAGAAVGLGAGLGGLAAACGGGGAATTTVSAGPEAGPEIKMGFVTPKTGAFAPFASTDSYLLQRFNEYVAGGQVLGDKKKHPISLIVADSQSDTNRAAQVAGDLIANSKVSLMVVASTPDTVNPVANQCEALGTPCFATDVPYQAFLGGAPEGGYKWTWLYNFGVEDFAGNYTTVWTAIPTNKKIAVMWPNDADGNAFASFMPDIIKGTGLTIVDGGRWQPGSEDYTQQISLFKREGCEIMEGVLPPPTSPTSGSSVSSRVGCQRSPAWTRVFSTRRRSKPSARPLATI
jgi:branched-chain amino acid transport system substrate-binding protein